MDQAPSIDKTQKRADIDRAERERRKRDLYKVYNPTNQDYEVLFNIAISPEVWVIKSKQESIVPAYVADKYFDEMSDRIITLKITQQIIDENDKWMGKMGRKMDLHTEQFRFENRIFKNLAGKKAQIVAVLNRGLHKEYGIDSTAPQEKTTREQMSSFDPGIDLETMTTTSPNAPEAPKVETPVQVQVIDEDDPELSPLTPEEEKRRKMLANLEKARAMRRKNANNG